MRANALLHHMYRVSPDLEKHAQPFVFDTGQVFVRSGAKIEHVMFLDTGMFSVTASLDDDEAIETGMIGSSGVVGASALLGSRQHIGTGIARIRGTGWRFDVDDLLFVVQADRSIREALIRWQEVVQAQAQQLVLCATKHHAGPRFASWLLRAQYATNNPCLEITYEQIAQLLGLRRASLSVAAQRFKAMKLISNSRRKTFILDDEGLERFACGCERQIRSHELRYLDYLT